MAGNELCLENPRERGLQGFLGLVDRDFSSKFRLDRCHLDTCTLYERTWDRRLLPLEYLPHHLEVRAYQNRAVIEYGAPTDSPGSSRNLSLANQYRVDGDLPRFEAQHAKALCCATEASLEHCLLKPKARWRELSSTYRVVQVSKIMVDRPASSETSHNFDTELRAGVEL